MDLVLRTIHVFVLIVIVTMALLTVASAYLSFREELAAEARQNQIGSLDDGRFAVRETSGKISFLTRSAS